MYRFAMVLFPQAKGLCLGMLCDMVEDVDGIAKYNLAQTIHSFLVYNMGLAVVCAQTREAGC